MKCIVFKSNLEKPSEQLLKAFDAKELDGYYYGELTEANIEKCKKSFTIWKPKFHQLTPKEQKIIAKIIDVPVSALRALTDSDKPSKIVWILDTYPDPKRGF